MRHTKLLSTLGALVFPILLSPPVQATVEMALADQPGAWFQSEDNEILPALDGTPLAIIDPGDKVRFEVGREYTGTDHTVTLLMKPEGSILEVDQAEPLSEEEVEATFDLPGVYLFGCKVHPYMAGVVAVRNPGATGPLDIPAVTAGSLPFIEHLGAPSLPATVVLSVLTTVAPFDANPDPVLGPLFNKSAKWDILKPGDPLLQNPQTPGVGEVWINTQFERVIGQVDPLAAPGFKRKPGTITVVDAGTFQIEREINGLSAVSGDGQTRFWNNPHNLWANFALDTMYNTNWFGKWVNKIDRAKGKILDNMKAGEAPTHIVTIPSILDQQQGGLLTIPLSGENDMLKVKDRPAGLKIVDKFLTGEGLNHPHGHWVNCGNGDRITVPNVFKGLGVAGSISIIDTLSGDIIKEFTTMDNPHLLMPIAAGECHVKVGGEVVNKAYVSNLVSGRVTVINVKGSVDGVPSGGEPEILGDIQVTLKPNGDVGGIIFDTLQVPLQTPVSPDGRFVVTAVFSLTTVERLLPSGGSSAGHVVVIDAKTDQVVKWLPTPAGTHGVNWGAKKGGGYFAYVTSQHANVLTVIDPDPNGDGDASDAEVAGTILLANGSPGAGLTDGTGGQGIKPIPLVHDGWIQKTVALAEDGLVSEEVADWIDQLTDEQESPEAE